MQLYFHQNNFISPSLVLNKKFFQKAEFADLKNQISTLDNKTFNNPLLNKKKSKPQQERKKLQKSEEEFPNSDEEMLREKKKDKQPKHASQLQFQVQKDLEMMNDDFYIESNEKDEQEDDDDDDEDEDIDQTPFPDEERKVAMYSLNVPISDMERRRRKLKKEREKLSSKMLKQRKEDLGQNKGEAEIIPEKKMDDYDIDQLASNLALAKKMMRKKTREEIIENSFNRMNFQEDEDLPKWFLDDEKKHIFKVPPITKEEFQQEKERLYAINNKLPKKVMEVKFRRLKKLRKKMKKASSKAQTVFDQEGIDTKVKMKEVEKIYKKAKNEVEHDKEKKYVVTKKGTAAKRKSSRFVKMVDTRLKKDKRADKQRLSKGTGAIKKKIKKFRQVHRRKRNKQKS